MSQKNENCCQLESLAAVGKNLRVYISLVLEKYQLAALTNYCILEHQLF